MSTSSLVSAPNHDFAAEFWQPLSPEDAERLDALQRRFGRGRASLIGYPANQVFDYRELFRFLEYAGNNIGDPFAAGTSGLQTHDFERDVIGQFAELLSAEPHDIWGYVTSGGTEGNLFALHTAREQYPDSVVYSSDESHYGIAKIVRLMRAPSEVIATRAGGEMNYGDLADKLRNNSGRPAIVVANIGTTMQGAIDDVVQIRTVLKDANINDSYIHCDAALSGLILPFVDDPPAFDFAAGVDSIAISGHKLIGTPLPCGVVLTKRAWGKHSAENIPYLGTTDATISGSRSAFGPLMLWYALRRLGRDGLWRLVDRCMELADYAVDKFAAYGVPAWRHEYSVTVVLPRPSDAALERWQMAARGDIAQLVTLPHVTKDVIDRFVNDCIAEQPAPNENAPA